MELQAAAFSTDAVPLSQRLPYWRDLVCDTFVELTCEAASPLDFSGSIKTRDCGQVRYTQVRSCRHQVVRDKRRIAGSNFDHFLLSLQLRGRGTLVQGGRTATLEPGDFAVYDVTKPYHLRFDDAFEQLVIQLPRDEIVSRLFNIEDLTGLRVSGQTGLGRLASSLIVQLASQLDALAPEHLARAQSSAVDLVAHALAKDTDKNSTRRSESQERTLRRILQFIEDNLSEQELTCEAVAAANGLSERYLRKLFQSKGQTVSGWIWAQRLDRAKQAIANPLSRHRSISAIAYDWGFKDAGHFSRAFKARFGMSPRDLRAGIFSPS